MARPLGFIHLLKQFFPWRFVGARATRLPVVGQLVYRLAFDGDAMVVVPKAQTIAVQEAVDAPGDMVLPAQVVDHFIEQAGYHWIMNFCICRDASHCRDYPIELGCLFLGEAARRIDPRLGRPATKDEALAHARRCRDAGLVHLIGRNKLDTLWLDVGPGDRLMTICHCCPCCCLWRMLPYLSAEIGDRISRMPGVQVTVTERCQGCGTCTQGVCFVGNIRMEAGRAQIGEACRGCGRCVEVCPNGAIELTVDDGAAVQTSIERIGTLVDVS